MQTYNRIRSIEKARFGDLTWSKTTDIPETDATFIICPLDTPDTFGKVLIRHENPKYHLSEYLAKENITNEVIKGDNVTIGNGVTFHGRVVIGSNTTIEDGCVIGCEGASYAVKDGKKYKLKHIGSTIIGSNVDIGVGSYVCRGLIESTKIGNGTKIGHNVGVGHNVQIGSDCIVLPKTTIGGSAIIGNGVYIAPHCFILNGAKIEDNKFCKANEVHR